ncbi:acyl-CoA thioesterase/bile acid-CoA:amino acid N-acyltransferase family protein [Caballeronia sp. dw_276]|jgi:pimeloyl-ACP methyl ester carboxylesterase|uniref:acyl-CoA thioester hydrolase/BAAT C-terminal domain-containing protein n=1 Tax=Caballeronia sp. dw_276 TaxID=2719795 RepID=UPI001BD4F6F0|nr:acyl-CoA thioesterase/bile acid-CoA:amino acid N-acyltransferase family protein [Caballeronia sp. dw_276]
MSARIEVTPHSALIDVARDIVLSGFAPRAEIDVIARQSQHDGSEWESLNRFIADETGRVDLRTAAPVSGDYAASGAEAMGIVWSMRCVKEVPGVDSIEPLHIEIEARDAHGTTAHASLIQQFIADGVTRREVREQGIVGTLFIPSTPGPHPAVIVLNGSGGGINEPRAALYAAHGIAAFALGYFKAPGLPPAISRTPLEYFARALDWLRQTVQPKNGFVAIAGQSRGAELALLLGATYPERVSAVIGYVPSAVLHGTLRAGAAGEAPDSIAWTLGGKALPHVWQNNRHADWSAFRNPPAPDEPIRQAPAFVSALEDADAVARSRIEVERIAGPILLISGTDDGFWPSSQYAGMIVDDLKQRGFAHSVEHLRYEGAGHSILFPHVPTTLVARPHPVAGVRITAGGTAAANAYANDASWPRVLRFIEAASGSL